MKKVSITSSVSGEYFEIIVELKTWWGKKYNEVYRWYVNDIRKIYRVYAEECVLDKDFNYTNKYLWLSFEIFKFMEHHKNTFNDNQNKQKHNNL